MRVSFLIAAYNEVATISQVLDRLHALPLEGQIVAVDDGSTDGTAATIERWRQEHPGLVLVRQAHRGKGAAIRAGIPYVDGDVVVIQDADLEYDPADIPALVEPIARGAVAVVFGSRLLVRRSPCSSLFWHRHGNRLLSSLTSILYGTSVSDMETGYKVFRADVLRSLQLTRDDFAIEPELTGEVCRRGLTIHELPISYRARSRAEGKKITWRDGLKAVLVLLQVRLRPRVPYVDEKQPDIALSARTAPAPRRRLSPAHQPD
jgi:glycosyltransferase involved in cell wall biosynthesis